MAIGNDASSLQTADSQVLVAQRLDALPVSGWHRRIVALIGLGSFFNFFEVALGTLLIPLLPAAWTATAVDKSLLVGAPFAGEMIGAFALARAADRFGRRTMFQVNLAGYAALALCCAASLVRAVPDRGARHGGHRSRCRTNPRGHLPD
jgi:MFS transporter, putative metabolite:H+ symporter